MKKTLAIVLSFLMLVCALPFGAAAADAKYDRAAIAAGDAEYISSLSDEQVLSVLLDWADREIASLAADFDSFELSVYGQNLEIDLGIDGINGILKYKDYLTQLGGDFAKLDTSLLPSERGSNDTEFVFSVIEFMAANSEIFGKVFSWEEGQTFYYGLVGEYITNPDNNVDTEIVDFYNNYLVGNDIQEKFVSEIAREMNYKKTENEPFDDIINNGIKGYIADLFSGLGLLSEDGVTTLKDNAQFDLRTTDIYTLVKAFVTLLQNDNRDSAATLFTYLLDNAVRPAMKIALGYTPAEGKEVAVTEALTNDFAAYYGDLEKLEEISGGKLYFHAKDGNYYVITLSEGQISGAKELTWGESLLNFEPPTVEIWDSEKKVGGEYTPVSADIESYEPTVYTDAKYAEAMQSDYLKDYVAAAESFGINVTTDAVPEAIKTILNGEGSEMKDKFVFKINGKVFGEEITDIEITFDEIEAAANQAISDMLPSLQTEFIDPTINQAVDTANGVLSSLSAYKAFLPALGFPDEFSGAATINSVTVKLAYTGYSDEDTFVCEVSVKPVYDISYTGNIWNYMQYAEPAKDLIINTIGETIEIPPFGKINVAALIKDIDLSSGTIEDIVDQAVEQVITNPVATIVVDNLNGSVEGLEDITNLMNFINTDFDVNLDILDFASNYDAYNGVIGQMNRILCDTLKMLLSAEGYASLGLTTGKNDNLTDNLEKLCAKADSIISLAKTFVDEAGFAEFTKGLSDVFASSHGFNAGMIYNLDFSSVENLYVCAIRLGCYFLVKDNSGILYDIHLIVEDMDTLDAMAVGVTNYLLAKAVKKANKNIDGFSYTYTAYDAAGLKNVNDSAKNADYAKNTIMNDLTNLAGYAVADWGVKFANGKVNEAIDTLNQKCDTDFPYVAFDLGASLGSKSWSVNLTNLVDRILYFAEGLVICAGDAAKCDNVFDKISTVANAVLPLGSLCSNCAANGFALDIDTVLNKYIFTDALAGDFEHFLGLFETDVKTNDVAQGVSVTKALIKSSEHIVDAFFPDTVNSEDYMDYTPAEKVQEYFTSSEDDAVIASNNMKSINGRKTALLPFAARAVKESGILPYFAACNNHVFGDIIPEVKATCHSTGHSAYKVCSVCGYKDGYTEYGKDAANHDGEKQNIAAVEPTCTKAGSTAGVKCLGCGQYITAPTTRPATGHHFGNWTVTKTADCVNAGSQTRSCSCGAKETQAIPATGNHVDADGNGHCDTCDKDLNPQDNSFFGKIKAFFQKIIDWFKNLFNF
ncbi:MAG: hypothetical protein MJ177_05780 [Clostridia bacterium]|nr:hypothetical protein [Clostridia bacterium]